MDQRPEKLSGADVSLKAYIQGYAYAVPEGLGLDAVPPAMGTVFDVRPLLKDKKSFKVMSKQDALAVYTAVNAIRKSGLPESAVANDTGIYITVGILPFEDEPLDVLYKESLKDGRFDMESFSTKAYHSLNPLLTFKCLPNMPLFHVSSNLGMHGRYYITYPGREQWFMSLQQALVDLACGRVSHALVGAVADQRNLLARHHLDRLPGGTADAVDCGVMLVLGRERNDNSIASIKLDSMSYSPRDPFREGAAAMARLPVHTGPAEPGLFIALSLEKTAPKIEYCLDNSGGFSGRCQVRAL